MKRQIEIFFVLLVLVGVIASGCSIEEFAGSGEPNGSIFVVSTDGAGTQSIDGGTIIVDGIQ